VSNLGLILDTSNYHDFYLVLGVTPGSLAEKLGLHAGDKLFAVDGEKATPSNLSTIVAKLKPEEPKRQLILDVEASGKRSEMTAQLDFLTLPGFTLSLEESGDTCGRIGWIAHKNASKNVFPIKLKRIDGDIFYAPEVRSGGPFDTFDRHFVERLKSKTRVEAGVHTLSFSSVMAADYLNNYRSQLRKVRFERKEIDIDVKPNMIYIFAAVIEDDEWHIKLVEERPYECESRWYD
jgi:hypothetical protein